MPVPKCPGAHYRPEGVWLELKSTKSGLRYSTLLTPDAAERVARDLCREAEEHRRKHPGGPPAPPAAKECSA